MKPVVEGWCLFDLIVITFIWSPLFFIYALLFKLILINAPFDYNPTKEEEDQIYFHVSFSSKVWEEFD